MLVVLDMTAARRRDGGGSRWPKRASMFKRALSLFDRVELRHQAR